MIRRARVPDLSQCDFGATGAATCSRGRTLGGGLGVPAIRLGFHCSGDLDCNLHQMNKNHFLNFVKIITRYYGSSLAQPLWQALQKE